MIESFRKIPFTEAIANVLQPHLNILISIFNDDVPPEIRPTLPVLNYFDTANDPNASGKPHEFVRNRNMFFAGDLSYLEQAQVANWLFQKLPNGKSTYNRWLGKSTMAHAITIVLADRHQGQILLEHGVDADVLAHAFEIQVASEITAVDVDKRCIAIFEKRLLERSAKAGAASNRQWGKDIGPHQGGWDPYRGIPSFWDEHAVFYPSDTSDEGSAVSKLEICLVFDI